MLAAKLFAVLAVVLALFAFVLSKVGITPANFYGYNKYVVADPTSFIKLGALACAIMACTHFVLGHWTKHPLNRAISLFSFVVFALSFVVQVSMELFLREGGRPHPTEIIALFTATLTLLFGMALFALSLTWTLASIACGTLRRRLSGHF